ncbi:YihY/virulence factor BrkB family protein [Specibacter sp. NPDC057265]|uniref:YihY/virulence factor BrkB family protein n=1 Tax=Specibacter sp. NPDC057265 TaxID=3346075 RepID=UPI003633CE42
MSAKPPLAAPDKAPPSPLDRRALAVWAGEKRRGFTAARRDGPPVQRALSLLAWLNARAAVLFPVRVWNLYTRRRGPVLAAGAAYLMFFSVGAMLVAGFLIFGVVAAGNIVLRDAVIGMVATSTPGLIDTGGGGLATPEELLGNGEVGVPLLVSLAALLFTAMGWVNGLREGIRSLLGLARDRTNPVLSKIRDVKTLLVLAVALVLTSVLGLLSTAATDGVGDFLAWGAFLTSATAQLSSILLMLVLDVAVAMIMFSMASRVRMPRRVLLLAALFSGSGATILRFFSGTALTGITSNPLLAPFAVILGLFVWFFLLSQVYLMSAAIAAVLAADRRPRRPSR